MAKSNYKMFKKVSNDELIRRMTWLSKRFPEYKIKCYTYYHDDIYDELKKLNIPFEKYRGPNYDSYAEDIWDYAVFLNIDKSEILDFTSAIENEQTYARIGIANKHGMLRTIFSEDPPKSLVIDNIEEFIKEMADNIFVGHEPLEFLLTRSEKKSYTQLLKENDNEKVIVDYDVTVHKTKKIKIT